MHKKTTLYGLIGIISIALFGQTVFATATDTLLPSAITTESALQLGNLVVMEKSVAATIPSKQGELTITGLLPIISYSTANLSNFSTESSDTKFATEINALITEEYETRLAEAKKDNSKSLDFSFDKKLYNDYLSIIMRTSATTVSTRESVKTFVLNTKAGEESILTLTDVLGINAIKISNGVISNEMAKKPGVYNADFKGITEKQNFYYDNGIVYVIFDKYEIGPGVLGTPIFEIIKSGIHEYTIDSYYTKEPYNLKMIPLRPVCTGLGFTVGWNSTDKSIEISRKNFLSVVSVGNNSYSKNKYPKTLESAPVLQETQDGGITYLPISFFELILDACYTVEPNGSITFSYYSANK